MKRLLFLLLFIAFFNVYSFEIIVVGKTNTNNSTIVIDELYHRSFFKNLKINSYGLGSLINLTYPGLSSTNTAVILNGITLNSLTNGGVDFANIPIFLLENANYMINDISFFNGINGVGGGINIDFSPKNKINTYLLIDNYHSTFSFLYPIRVNKFLFNICYENSNGNAGRTNSDFNRNFFSLSFSPIHNLIFLYIKSFENMGVPGPVPSDDPHSFTFNGTDSMYPQNRQNGTYEDFFISFYNRFLYFSFNNHYNQIKYYFKSQWFENTSINTEESIKAFLKLNLLNNTSFIVKSGINYLGLEGFQHSYKRSNLFLQIFSKYTGLGVNTQLYTKNFQNYNYSGMLYFDHIFLNIHLFSSISSGIRFPTYNELYYPFGGNDKLKDEHSISFNIRLKYRVFKFLYEKKYIKNLILWVPYDYFYYKAENIGKKSINQYTLTCQFNINNFYFYNDISYFHGWEENVYSNINGNSYLKREAASYLPNLKINSIIIWNIGNFNIKLNTFYTGKMINNYIHKELPARFIVDFSIKYGFITLGINNLFNNTKPINFGYSIEDKDFPSMGRTFFIKWTTK